MMDSRRQARFRWRIATARLVSISMLFAAQALYSPLWAVDCNPLSMTLHTQSEVDGFQQTYGPCDRVLTLYVEGADITNLDGLSALSAVGSSLYIQNNPVLSSIAGLGALASVGRHLWVWNNGLLTGLDGLATLDSVGGMLAIHQNPALKNIDGLSALNMLGGSLVILDNAALTDVNGLSGLTSVAASASADQRFLHIEDNPVLASLDGLSSVTVVGRASSGYAWVIINNNAALSSIGGLHSLTDIWGDLNISNNAKLAGIDGLSSLSRVIEVIIYNNASLSHVDGLHSLTNVSRLFVSGNASLTSLDGFSALTAVWNDLAVSNNNTLSQCMGISRLLDSWDDAEAGPGPGEGGVPDVGGDVVLEGNLAGCNSIQEVLAEIEVSKINAGLNDAWYNPETSGQGFFITVFPDLGVASLAWFTYDTELPGEDVAASLGDPGHRWLTATGPVVGNQVFMDIEFTSGGLFDTATEIQRTDPPGSDGTIVLTFTSCNSGTAEYDIPSIERQGSVPIRRVAYDNISLCEALNAY